ncbi:MAG: hypothetical protein KGQ37_11250 [Hyphomicrobiales bacterium]|nr:hypothetical protein [Hyphomicrobiales bacterium]
MGGFRFGGMSHRGSLLVLPSGIRAWPVTQAAEISLATLAPLFDEPAGEIGLCVIGTGTSQVFLPPELVRDLRARGLNFEVMSTGAAARTYNVLFAEGRLASACLIAVA